MCCVCGGGGVAVVNIRPVPFHFIPIPFHFKCSTTNFMPMVPLGLMYERVCAPVYIYIYAYMYECIEIFLLLFFVFIRISSILNVSHQAKENHNNKVHTQRNRPIRRQELISNIQHKSDEVAANNITMCRREEKKKQQTQ